MAGSAVCSAYMYGERNLFQTDLTKIPTRISKTGNDCDLSEGHFLMPVTSFGPCVA